jgi:hypothetical protein
MSIIDDNNLEKIGPDNVINSANLAGFDLIRTETCLIW